MQKFTKLEESKKFIPDAKLLKSYAAYIIPLYINKLLKIDDSLLNEYLEMNKKTNSYQNTNFVSDLEIEAIKSVLENPTTINGFSQLKKEVEGGCPKLQNFLRKYFQNIENFK